MLKYTNTTKTAAQFNGASFSLAAPEDFASIGDGPTRDAVLKWIAAGNTPQPAQTAAEIAAEAVAVQNAKAKAALEAIDAASIRSIREYIAAKPDAPVFLKTQEALAVTARSKIK